MALYLDMFPWDYHCRVSVQCVPVFADIRGHRKTCSSDTGAMYGLAAVAVIMDYAFNFIPR